MVKIERKYIVLIPAVAALAWVLDAAFDAFILGSVSFLDALFFKESTHDICIQWFFIAFYSVFSIVIIKSLTKQHQIKGELRKHLTAIEISMDGVAIFNAEHVYLFTNDAYADITGFRSPKALVGKTFRAIYDDEQLAWIEKNVFPVLDKKGRWHGELAAHRKDGTVFVQEASITQLPDRGCVCVMRDITERKERADALERSERFMRTIFDSIRDPFCIIDRNYRIVRANEAYAALKKKAAGDLLNRTCYEALVGRSSVCEGCIIEKTLSSGDPCAKEKKIAQKDGETLWLEIYTYPILDYEGEVQYVIEYTRDITERKRYDADRKLLIERLEHLSKADGLTSLLNRRALNDQLIYEIERARRYAAPLSIILCDMDNLKEINDTHGHLVGDMAIQMTAATIRNALRSTDIAGRYGGDEFLVIAPETALSGVQSIAGKIKDMVQKTEVRFAGNKTIMLSLSMGITALDAAPDDVDSMISRVDAALYGSKREGRNRITTALRPEHDPGQ